MQFTLCSLLGEFLNGFVVGILNKTPKADQSDHTCGCSSTKAVMPPAFSTFNHNRKYPCRIRMAKFQALKRLNFVTDQRPALNGSRQRKF